MPMSTEPPLWTANFFLLATANCCLALLFYLLVVITGGFATELGASLSTAGLAVGMFVIGAFIGRLSVGQVIDRWDRKRTLILSMLAFSVLTFAHVYVTDVTVLIILRFVHGFFVALGGTALGAMIARIIPESRRAEGIGYYGLSTSIATAIGPFLGLWMMRHGGYEPIFYVSTGIGLLAVGCGYFLKFSDEETGAVPRHEPFSILNLVERKVVPIAIIIFLSGLFYSSVLAYIQIYVQEINLVEVASWFFVFYSVAIMCSRPIAGRIMDRRGANVVMLPCILSLAVGLLILGFAHHGAVLLLSGVLIGFGFGNIQSGGQAIATKLVDPQRMGLAMSTCFVFLDAGLGFGPYLIGFIIPHTGFRTLYVLMAVGTALSAVLYWSLHGRRDAVLWKRKPAEG